MNLIEHYIQDVLQSITAPPDEKARITADLRAHLEEARSTGSSPAEILQRMGAPREVAREFMSGVQLQPAGFWRRLAAFGVDMLLIILMAGALAACALLLSNLVPKHPSGLGYLSGALLILAVAGCALGAVAIILAYFPLLEGRFGQTPGKRLLGLWVLTEDGLPIGTKEAVLRRLSFYFEILPLDALFIVFTERKQRAFDIVARTLVVHF